MEQGKPKSQGNAWHKYTKDEKRVRVDPGATPVSEMGTSIMQLTGRYWFEGFQKPRLGSLHVRRMRPTRSMR